MSRIGEVMSKLLSRLAGFFSNRNLAGVDKAGNRYFTRKEEIDGISKWVSVLFCFFSYFLFVFYRIWELIVLNVRAILTKFFKLLFLWYGVFLVLHLPIGLSFFPLYLFQCWSI